MHPAAEGGARPVQMALKRNGKSLDKGKCFRIQCPEVRGWPTLWNHKLSDICQCYDQSMTCLGSKITRD